MWWGIAMPKWFEMAVRVFPWKTTERDDTRRLVGEAAKLADEQEALAPMIEDQTDYLVSKGEINGFTRQLQLGFQRRLTGE